MKKIIASILFLMMFLAACSSKANDKKEIAELINSNLKAAQNEDLKEYMSAIHPGSPIYADTETFMKMIFDTYDLEYEVRDIKFIKIGKTEASASWFQRTVKVSGPEFKNLHATVVHTFKKHDGKWKMFTGQVKDLVYE